MENTENLSSSNNTELFANNSQQFIMNLYNEFVKKQSGKNIIFSPFSIQMCIALAYFGSKNDTAKEIKNSLNLKSFNDDTIKEIFDNIMNEFEKNNVLTVANKIYIDQKYELNENYSNDIQKYLHSEIDKIDVSKATVSAKQINGWVENKTNNKIKNLISPQILTPDTTAVLINAIHFKGEWKRKFPDYKTMKDNFWIEENKSIKIDMMRSKDNYDYAKIDELNATALQLPYNKCNLSLLIVLPNERNGLKTLEDKLKNFSLLDLMKQMHSQEIEIKIPKFKIEFEIELNEPLQNLGMQKMFTDEADFGNILATKQPIKISKAIHKAFIEVNEEGTEAAAATSMLFLRCAAPMANLSKNFYADRPFVYFIKAENNSFIYFMGNYLGDNNN